MWQKLNLLFVSLVVFFGLVGQAQEGKEVDLERLFEKAYFLETVERNLDGAISVYEALLALRPQDQRLIARTSYQLAQCFEKQGHKVKAKTYYRRLVENFPQEKELGEAAKRYLGQQNYSNAQERIAKTLEGTLSLDFSEAPMLDIIGFLRQRLQLNFVVTQAYLKTAAAPVDIRLMEAKMSSVLQVLTDMREGNFAVLHGAIVIGTRQEIAASKDHPWPDVTHLPTWAQSLEQKLKDQQCSMEFSEAPLGDVVRNWSKTFNVNIVTHPQVSDHSLVSLHLMDTSALDALRILCLYHGNLIYDYKAEGVLTLLPLSEYHKNLDAAGKKELVLIDFRLKYDVPPPRRYPECRALFIDDKGIVRMLDVEVPPRLRIASGSYKLKLQQPGYFELTKDVTIEPSASFVIEETLMAIPRPLAFDVIDAGSNKPIEVEKMFVAGKLASHQDSFKPGIPLEVMMEFKDYDTYRDKITIEPGKGPFVIRAMLKKKDTK